jgi:hypothetical protein
MNTEPRYQTLQELADALQSSLARLAGGDLAKAELEQLTLQARELYERLVVLRHKAFESEFRGEQLVAHEHKEEEERPVLSFRVQVAETPEVPPVSPNQVSLIDVIEEITREESPVKEEEPAAEATALKPMQITAPENLNDRLSKAIPAQETLARKLESSPIGDLKRAITLNQRFQFARELFKGNNQDYEVTIDKLNNSSREDALKTLENLRARYEWNDESPVTQDFKELVQRRHQS